MARTNENPFPGRVLLIVPAYNEAANLPAVVADAAEHAPWADVVVVDDCSADDTVADPISYLGSGAPCEEWATSIEVGGPVYLYSLWDIRVQGETPDGAKKRLQASATRCYAYDG